MGLLNLYADTIKKELGYFSIWEPGQQLELGDYGYLEDNVFKQKGNIKALGIEIVERPNKNISHHKLNSQDSVNVDFGTAADVAGQAKATVKITFTKDNGIFFNAAKCTSVSIENKDDIGKKLIELYKKDQWERAYVVVMEKVTAKGAQIVISKSAGSEAVLEAESPNIAKIDLADANAKLKLTKEKSIDYKFIGNNCIVLQSLWKVQKKFLSPLEFKPRDIDCIEEEEFEFANLDSPAEAEILQE